MAADAVELLADALKLAHKLYTDYRARTDKLKSFAWLMSATQGVLEDIRSVPPHAAIIVAELHALLLLASEKVERYTARRPWHAAIRMHNEATKMADIERNVRQLLPLLTISVASHDDVRAAVADLQRRMVSLQGECAESAHHLHNFSGAVALLSRDGATADHVQLCISNLSERMCWLQDHSTQRVLGALAEVPVQINAVVTQILRDMDAMKHAFAALQTVPEDLAELREGQEDMAASQEQMVARMQDMCDKLAQLQVNVELPSEVAQALRQSGLKILEEIMSEHMQQHGGDGASTSRAAAAAHANVQPPGSSLWARAMHEAIRSGRLQITACLVLGVPLMAVGLFRPVTLPCCRLVVSLAGAEACVRQGHCRLCNVPLPPEKRAELQVDKAVAASVAAEECGIAPPLLDQADVALGRELGHGSEGHVFAGTLRGRPVAVKVIRLASTTRRPQQVGSVRHVLAASHLAGLLSPHVCKLLGYCWTDAELWLVTELCHGTLDDLVANAIHVKKYFGLPPLDVVTLGLMLCCALHAVHRGARYLHLDIKPSNVLFTGPLPAASADGKVAPEAVAKLADFGFAAHLPQQLTSSLLGSSQDERAQVEGVARGTPGYAPYEQLRGHALRQSDVYSLGATLKFAAAGRHPFGAANTQAITQRLHDGECMEVPEYIYPPLRALIQRMVAMEPPRRPRLSEVVQELVQMRDALIAAGHTPEYFAAIMDACMLIMRAPQPTPAGAPSAEASAQHAERAAPPPPDAQAAASCPVEIVQPKRERRAAAPATEAHMHGTTPAASPSSTQSMQSAWADNDCLTSQHDLCAWVTTHKRGDSASLQGATVRMDVIQWPAAPENRRVISALATQDSIPSRTQNPMTQTKMSHVSGGGGTVSGGTLHLGPTGLLLLDGRCDMRFEGVVFEGGTIVCLGEGTRLTVASCRFSGCILLAIDGAQVTLGNVSFRHLRDSSLCYALTARGPKTRLVAYDVRVWAWAGCLVEQGAEFDGTKLHIADVSFAAMHVRGAGSRASVTCASMFGRAERQPSAFQVAARAHVEVSQSFIKGFSNGMHAMDGAEATVHRSTVSQSSNCGVVAEGAQVSLKEVHIECAREKGIYVSGHGTRLTAEDCAVIRPRVAVCMNKGAIATLTRCILREGLTGGLQVDGAGTAAECTACVFKSNSDSGVRVASGAEVRLADCSCNEAGQAAQPGCGYLVQGHASLRVLRGVCRAHGAAPACIVEAGSTLDTQDATISGRVSFC